MKSGEGDQTTAGRLDAMFTQESRRDHTRHEVAEAEEQSDMRMAARRGIWIGVKGGCDMRMNAERVRAAFRIPS